jgi:heterotetrameric sarcosine oxidase delta subunit
LSFLLPCPNCGSRSVYEFEFGGEYQVRPGMSAPFEEWIRYIHLRTNSSGFQTEWWYHRLGCRLWFLAQRNTSTNQVQSTFWLEQLESKQTTEGSDATVGKLGSGGANDQA